MQTRVTLAALVVYVHLSLALAGASIRGLDPALADKYKPNAAGNFVCLDGSAEIPFARVNDDYCDCADGSDEPGTSACNNGSFYCANAGHIPVRIDSSKVNDGICDEQCCDGSDEWDSDANCTNRCEEVGRKHRERLAEVEAATKAGSEKHAQLVREASGLRKIKREELSRKEVKLAEAEKKLAGAEALKNEMEEKDSKMKEDSDKDRESRKKAIYEEYLPDLITYRKFVAAELHKSRYHRDTLILLLRSVRKDHNPEFNDEAVAKAVKEYSEFVDAYPYIENAALTYADEDEKARAEREAHMDRDNAAQDDVSYDACSGAINILENERNTIKDDIDMFYGWLADMRSGYNKNYHDLAVKAAVVGLGDYEKLREKELKEIDEQGQKLGIRDLKEKTEQAKVKINRILDEAAAAEGNADSGDGDGQQTEQQEFEKKLSDARSAFWDAQNEKNTLSSDVSNLKELLEKDLGPHDVYLSLKDECFSLNTGEYTYEICLLDRASQISNKDQSRQNLGSFTEFGTKTELNSDGSQSVTTDYTVHKFLHGTKCWNGPNRSLIATFECAQDIKVLSVTEPEKCEYHAKVTGPFACPLPLLKKEKQVKVEKAQEEAPLQAPRVPGGEQKHKDVHDEL
ncbi:hypothetical protein GGI12_003636 [Dipsacomyces acuminosporus]|nr:hypothetical protein GGI12_003636 [Dipsacomyces acuminosporus]